MAEFLYLPCQHNHKYRQPGLIICAVHTNFPKGMWYVYLDQFCNGNSYTDGTYRHWIRKYSHLSYLNIYCTIFMLYLNVTKQMKSMILWLSYVAWLSPYTVVNMLTCSSLCSTVQLMVVITMDKNEAPWKGFYWSNFKTFWHRVIWKLPLGKM